VTLKQAISQNTKGTRAVFIYYAYPPRTQPGPADSVKKTTL